MKIKRSGIITKLIILILLIYAVSTLVGLRSQINSATDERDRLSNAVDAKNASNAELEYAVEHSDEPDVIEEIARDKLDLAYPDEDVFYTE